MWRLRREFIQTDRAAAMGLLTLRASGTTPRSDLGADRDHTSESKGDSFWDSGCLLWLQFLLSTHQHGERQSGAWLNFGALSFLIMIKQRKSLTQK